MKYEVWLNFRHPKTLESVAAVRAYAHDDRLRAEAVLEHAQADFQPLVLELLRVHPGALVNAEMRQRTVVGESAEFKPLTREQAERLSDLLAGRRGAQ